MASLTEYLINLEQLDLILNLNHEPELEYAFKQVFTQESVYGSLLFSDRRELHQAVGTALETILPELPASYSGADIALLLAYHFEQSGDKPRALKYFKRAAANAGEAYANEEAKALHERALALLGQEDYPARWTILAGLEVILDRLGQRKPQANVLTQMQILAQLMEDYALLATTHNRRAAYFDKVSEYQAAAEAAEVGLRQARRSHNARLEAQSLNSLALAAWRRFDYFQVQHWALAALESLKVVGEPAVHVTSLFHLGKASYRLGQYDLALHYLQAAQELTQETQNLDGQATSHMILGWIYQRLGDYERAAENYRAKLEIRRRMGNRYGEATALSHLGWLAYDQGQAEAGLDYCRQALDISYAINDRENEAYALSGLGLNYERLGQYHPAAESYGAAHSIHADIGATTLAIFDQTGLARVALAEGDREAMQALITPVVNWIQWGHAQKFWDPWIIYLSSYRVLTALGDIEAARSTLFEARRLLHQRAEAISDLALRECFFSQVEVNRELIQAATQANV
jgi:tetratricopeptide (TPR) repeat protein